MNKSLIEKIQELLSKKECVILAIDGFCTAGKTTLANDLKKELDANVFHADDYFLRSSQKTKKRLNEIGGNFDYERFKSEIVDSLPKREEFCYRPYDCKTGELLKPICVQQKRVVIIEGSYCLHPHLGEYYDIAVFMDVSHDLQRERVLQRDKSLHQRFFEEWIPKEQAYFEAFGIKSRCQIHISNNEET